LRNILPDPRDQKTAMAPGNRPYAASGATAIDGFTTQAAFGRTTILIHLPAARGPSRAVARLRCLWAGH